MEEQVLKQKKNERTNGSDTHQTIPSISPYNGASSQFPNQTAQNLLKELAENIE